jgi:hypothetical protein
LWQLGENAKYQLHRLPAPGDVIASLRALEVDRETKPPLETVLELVAGMLDVWAIEPNQTYVAFVAAKLGKFSPATIAQTIDQALTELRPEGGRSAAAGRCARQRPTGSQAS